MEVEPAPADASAAPETLSEAPAPKPAPVEAAAPERDSGRQRGKIGRTEDSAKTSAPKPSFDDCKRDAIARANTLNQHDLAEKLEGERYWNNLRDAERELDRIEAAKQEAA